MTATDTIEIVEPTPVEEQTLPCPDCETALEISTKEEWAPDYRVDCPACSFSDYYVAG